VEYFQTHIFVSAPERLTSKLSKIKVITCHKHVIKGIQARATRTCAPVHYLTGIKGTHSQAMKALAHWQDHGPHAPDLTADK